MGNSDIISKKAIAAWLEAYADLYRAYGAELTETRVQNSGKKSADGISNAVLKRAMLSAALKEMKKEAWILYGCCLRRWLRPWTLGLSLRWLGLTRDQYYYRCDYVVDYLYFHVNHMDEKRLDFISDLKRKNIL